MSPATNSSRWCPTPEQLMILEEMYRSGTRTPNASQIQQITAHLSFYGKIEGKNVFYWFQNHKARDRQKLRRKLYKQLQQQQQQQQALYHHQHQHQYMMMNSFNTTANFNHYCQNNNNHNHNTNIGLNYSANNSVLTSAHFHHHLPQSSIATMPQVQGGLFEDKYHQAPSTQNYNNEYHNHHHLMSYNRKMEANDQSHMMRVYDRDWMMMFDHVGPETTNSPTPSNVNNINKPLQTLELFPVTSTNLKEDSSTTTTTSSKLSPTN